MLNKRSNQPELMDLGPSHYTYDEYRDCLSKLATIGTLLGGDRATLSAFKQLKTKPRSIVDVGCGGGWFTCKLAHAYPEAIVVGVDIDDQALAIAHQHKLLYEKKYNVDLKNLTFQRCSSTDFDYGIQSYDVITATLICHHLTDQQLISFFQAARRAACQAVIINDLHRNPLAYAGFWLISPFFGNRLIRYDGLLSIARSFKRAELISYLRAAGFASACYTIMWRWAFRWIITIDCS